METMIDYPSQKLDYPVYTKFKVDQEVEIVNRRADGKLCNGSKGRVIKDYQNSCLIMFYAFSTKKILKFLKSF